jgi:G protein-coupled receptor 107
LTVFDFQLAAPTKPHSHEPHYRGLVGRGGGSSSATTMTTDALTESIKGVGFLLKRFNNEADFNHYMNWISANDSRCIFQSYLERDDDDFGLFQEIDDDYVYDGSQYDDKVDDYLLGGNGIDDNAADDLFGPWNSPDDDTTRFRTRRRQQSAKDQGAGEVSDFPTVDGIFLNMMPRSRWKPNTPFVAYDFEAGEAGLYFLMYQVCFRDGISKNKNQLLDIHSRFELDFHFSNLDFMGHKSYLPAGEMPLPWIFFVFSVVYGILLYLWISNIVLIKEGKPGHFNKDDVPVPPSPIGRGVQLPTASVYPIHYMMGVLLALKFLSLLFESIRYHYLRVTGNAMFWSAVYYTFAFLKGISLFTVILLIGTGWSFVKPFLSDREKKMIFAVLALQVVNNIAIVVLTQETEGEKSFDRWTAILHLVDIFCCCAVLIPIVWQVNQLEKNMEQDQHDEDDDEEKKDILDADEFDDEHLTEDELEGGGGRGSTGQSRRPPDARLASKLKLFRSFYLLVIAYIYITRIAVYLFAATLNYKHTWIRYFTVELVTLVFYFTVGKLFRPMNENPYLHLRRASTQINGTAKVEMKKIDPKTKSVID